MTRKALSKKSNYGSPLLLCAFFFVCNASLSASPKSQKTLVMRQSSDSLGTITTYINKSALKILTPDTDCYLIAKAPTWKVVLYNARNKCGFEMSSAEFLKHQPRFMMTSFDNRWAYLIMPKEKLTWLGMPATRFLFPCRKVNGVLIPPPAMKGEYITGQSSLVNSKTCTLLQKTLMAPQGPGIPLYLITKGPELKRSTYLSWRTGGDTPLLRTIRTEEKDVADSFFTYPTGYTRKDLEVDVLMDKSRKQAIEEMVEHMENFK